MSNNSNTICSLRNNEKYVYDKKTRKSIKAPNFPAETCMDSQSRMDAINERIGAVRTRIRVLQNASVKVDSIKDASDVSREIGSIRDELETVHLSDQAIEYELKLAEKDADLTKRIKELQDQLGTLNTKYNDSFTRLFNKLNVAHSSNASNGDIAKMEADITSYIDKTIKDNSSTATNITNLTNERDAYKAELMVVLNSELSALTTLINPDAHSNDDDDDNSE